MSKAMILKIVAIVVAVCFFLPFFSVYGFVSISGVSTAFSFASFGAVLLLIAFLAAVASAVFGFLPKLVTFMDADKFCLLLELAVAVLVLLVGIITGFTAVGWWFTLIFSAGYVAFDMFGDKLLKR